MTMRHLKWKVLVTLATALVAGVLAGAVIAAHGDDGAPSIDSMEAAIETTAMTKVADIAAQEGSEARGVYLQELDTGYVCVWDAAASTTRTRQGGCNAIDDPLGGSAVSANLAYEGGPAIETVRDARLSGLVSADTAALEVLMSDGTRRAVRLKPAKVGSDDFQAFGYRCKRSDLRRGIGPIAVIARAADGSELGRQTTGVG